MVQTCLTQLLHATAVEPRVEPETNKQYDTDRLDKYLNQHDLYIYICVYVCEHVCACVCAFVQACMCMSEYACVHVCLYACTVL